LNVGTLETTPLFANLSKKELGWLLQEIRPGIKNFERGDVLWRQGDRIGVIAILEEGTLLSQKDTLDGKRQLVRIFEPPDIISLESAVSRKGTNSTHIIAAAPGHYLYFPLAKITKNKQLPPAIAQIVMQNILFYVADDCIRFINKSEILAHRTVRNRVIAFLRIVQSLHGDILDIGMNQEELAQFLCVDRSSLSETLNKMRREGLIEFSGSIFSLHLIPLIPAASLP
jgi:CRP-like cAMP-binding protein